MNKENWLVWNLSCGQRKGQAGWHSLSLPLPLSGIPSISSKQLVIGVRELLGYLGTLRITAHPVGTPSVGTHHTDAQGPERACFLLGFLQGSSDGWPPDSTSD